MHQRYRHLLVSCVLAILTAGVAVRAGDIRYMYDELGRLVGVVDSNGDAAFYTYDAVGNILSIARVNATTTAIAEFTPNGAPVGTTVTLYGTGFSATPSQNAVTFNGVSATVTSSSANEIVTSVPSSATTGPIAVTTPNGSATSSSNFVVTTTGAPTITGFTPAIASVGISVTVSGTNFETTLPNNRLFVNLTRAPLASATATSLGMTVPHFLASGRVSLTTPAGSVTSTDDLFVPPGSYTATEVASTSRLTVGTAQNVAVGTANKIGLTIFDATAGHRVSVKAAPGPISVVTLYRPDATVLGSVTVGATQTLIEPKVVPVTGTYQVMVDPTGAATGTTAITVYDVPDDVTGTITAGGSSVAVAVTTPGQNGSLTFDGDQDQRVSLKIVPGPASTVAILNTDTSTLASTPVGIATAFIEPQTLSTTGSYRITVNPNGVGTGTTTLTLYDVPADITGTLTIGAAATPVTISAAGQNAAFEVSGTASQQVTVRITGNNCGTITVKLLKPDGSTLTSSTSVLSNFNLATQTLPTSGTYRVTIDPSAANMGSLNVAVTSP